MPKISIIIPVYNAEKYLNTCLDSVLNQTEKDLEIICVDDCSTDGSLDILKAYNNKDARITLIQGLENHGVSQTRNIGLKYISGEYVCFLDSDDYLENTFCEKLLKRFDKDTNLVCTGHIKLNELGRKISPWLPLRDQSYDVMKDINDFTKHRNVSQKMFKTDIIKNNNLEFATDLHYMEDALFLITYLFYCKKINSVKEPLYVVRINQNSLCRSIKYKERREQEKIVAKQRINAIIKKYNEKSSSL